MKSFKTVAVLLAASALAGCMSSVEHSGGYDPRYNKEYPATKVLNKDVSMSFNPLASMNSAVAEAERKSISNDLPYAVVE